MFGVADDISAGVVPIKGQYTIQLHYIIKNWQVWTPGLEQFLVFSIDKRQFHQQNIMRIKILNRTIYIRLGFLLAFALVIAVVYLFYRIVNYPAAPASNGTFFALPDWTF